jgi:hypothetical protein
MTANAADAPTTMDRNWFMSGLLSRESDTEPDENRLVTFSAIAVPFPERLQGGVPKAEREVGRCALR